MNRQQAEAQVSERRKRQPQKAHYAVLIEGKTWGVVTQHKPEDQEVPS